MTKSRTPPAWWRAFLCELARTGSVRLAAEVCGIDRSSAYQLRRRNAAFAASWARAVGVARERLSPCEGGGRPRVGARSEEVPACAGTRELPGKDRRNCPKLRANETIRSSKAGKCCIMRVGPGRWSAAKEAAFLAELTASANVKAAGRAAGISTQAAYNRRKLWPAFKSEWDAAVAEGFARIETLLVCAATTTLDPEPLPERAGEGPDMSVEQALKLHLAHRAVQQGARRGGPQRRVPNIEEVRAEIMRKVAAIKRARGLPS